MKKFTLFFTLIILFLVSHPLSAQTAYVGGSLNAVYYHSFQLKTHFFGGYEFNDRWAIGGGIGLDLAASNRNSAADGFVGAYVRFTPWHNDVLYTDIKWRTEALIGNGIEGADVGLCGSLRFRVSEHIDIFTDFMSLGARYSGGDFDPLIGVLSDGCSLGLHYRF